MLAASNLIKRFGGFTAIGGASITVLQGSITACVGPNGAGKSTLVNLLSGSLALDEGSIMLDNIDITRAPAWRRAEQGLRRTFQTMTGIGEMTVRQNLELGLWNQRKTASAASKPAASSLERIIDQLALGAYHDDVLNQLPLGIQRKVGIGVAMTGHPRYLLLDEPLAGTEAGDRAMLLQLFRDLAGQELGIMWIEHDLASVRSTADLLVVVDKGTVIAHGPVETVVNDRAVQHAYWGTATVA